jgi:hypothetical protein
MQTSVTTHTYYHTCHESLKGWSTLNNIFECSMNAQTKALPHDNHQTFVSGSSVV